MRRNRQEPFDFRPAHQKLHADPGAKRKSGDPDAARIRMQRLYPVERRGGIRQFADAMVEEALASANAAEIEPQGGKTAFLVHPEQAVDYLIVHRAAKSRMRMENDGNRRGFFAARLVSSLKATVGPCEYHFRHG